jgi:hypothetical protein
VFHRAVHVRPYFFEVFTILNFVIIQAMLWRITRAPLHTLGTYLLVFIPTIAIETVIGVLIRAAYARRKGTLHEFMRVVRSPLWLTDTARIVIFSAFTIQTYCWIKIAIPLLNGRNYDAALWNLDSALLFGRSPDLFILDLFSSPFALRAVDWTYANVFFATLTFAPIFFGSSPSRRLRLAFIDSNTAMWIIGAWIYVLIPSLGPAYRFPDIWQPLSHLLDRTQTLQRTLMSNYTSVLQYRYGVMKPVNILFGIAAFPSLHVGFATLVFLWMRRLWRHGQVVFGIILALIFLGSIVTGWHYLIDGLAGALLAGACYSVVCRQYEKHGRRFFDHAESR